MSSRPGRLLVPYPLRRQRARAVDASNNRKRFIANLRGECTDHLIVLNERHLERLLREYVEYYNASRTHFALERNAPIPRAREPTPAEELVATPVLGGLHHTYRRAA